MCEKPVRKITLVVDRQKRLITNLIGVHLHRD